MNELRDIVEKNLNGGTAAGLLITFPWRVGIYSMNIFIVHEKGVNIIFLAAKHQTHDILKFFS